MLSYKMRHFIAAWLLAAYTAKAQFSGGNVTIYMITPMCEGDYDTCGWPAGASMNVAAQKQVEMINAVGLLRGNVQLNMKVRDDHCSPNYGSIEASQIMLTMLSGGEVPFGVLGSGCSGSTMSIARMFNTIRMPLISHAASSTGLSNRAAFPNFYRMYPPDGPSVAVWFGLCDTLGWNSFALTYDSDYGIGMVPFVNSVIASYPAMTDLFAGVDAAYLQVKDVSFYNQIARELIRVKARVLLAVMYSNNQAAIMCQMYKEQMADMYSFRLGWYAANWQFADLTVCTQQEMATITDLEIIAIAPTWGADSTVVGACNTPGYTIQDFISYYNQQLAATGTEDFMSQAYAADAVCMMALMFNEMMDFTGDDLTPLFQMDEATYTEYNQRAQAISFTGVSGPVSFPPDATQDGSGDRIADFNIYQYVNGVLDNLGVYVTSGGPRRLQSGGLQLSTGKSLTFTQGYTMANPPPPLVPTCLIGQVFNYQLNQCEGCPAGKEYLPLTQTCECVPGSYKVGLTCQTCPGGNFSELAGSAACAACIPGKYSDPGAVECIQCSQGSFAPSSGMAACVTCDATFTTNLKGATDRSQCVCPEEKVYDRQVAQCVGCDFVADRGVECPGGHSVTDTNEDYSPILLPGYMSTASNPYSVFTCINEDERCEDERPLTDTGSTCPENFDPNSDMCSACLDGWRMVGDECIDCGDDAEGFSAKWLMPFKVLALAIVESVIISGMYINVNKPQVSGMISIELLINYVQVLQEVSGLPLLWPSLLQDCINLMELASIGGFLGLFGIHVQCLTSGSYWLSFLMTFLAPLSVVFLFVPLWCISQLIPFPFGIGRMNVPYIMNTCGSIYFTVFVSIICAMLSLFITEKMPNGKMMVAGWPGCEMGSSLWLQAAPVSFLGAVISMCFFAYIARAVWIAPRYAPVSQAFNDRYRFAFENYRPDRWWWILIELTYYLFLALAQVVTQRVHMRIYLLTFILITNMVVCFEIQPWKYIKNNLVDMTLQICLTGTLVTFTSFIEREAMEDDEFTYSIDVLAVWALIFIIVACLAAACGFGAWLFSLIKPPHGEMARILTLAVQFRDLVTQLILMPHKDFMTSVEELNEFDQKRLNDVMTTLVSLFLEKQPDMKLFHQRRMPGIPFGIWDQRDTTTKVLKSSVEGEAASVLHEQSWDRLLMMILSDDLRNKNFENEKDSGMAAGLVRSMSKASGRSSTHAMVQNLVIKPQGSKADVNPQDPEAGKFEVLGEHQASEGVSANSFAKLVGEHTILGAYELNRIFEFIDYDGKAEITMEDLTVAMQSCDVKLDDGSRKALRDIFQTRARRNSYIENQEMWEMQKQELEEAAAAANNEAQGES